MVARIILGMDALTGRTVAVVSGDTEWIAAGRATARAASRLPFRAVGAVCAATMLHFPGLRLHIPEIPRFVIGPLHQGDPIVGASVAAFSVTSVLGRLPLLRVGDRLGPVAGHAAYPAMFGVAVLVTLCGAGLVFRAIHPPQRKGMP